MTPDMSKGYDPEVLKEMIDVLDDVLGKTCSVDERDYGVYSLGVSERHSLDRVPVNI